MFRITPEQLKAADGKVRCCQCNRVFNALHNLMESPASFINDADLQIGLAETDLNEIAAVTASQPLDGETKSDGLVIESSLVSDSEVEKSLDALADEELPIQQLDEESILEVDENSSELDSKSQFLLERDDGLETEPDYFAAGSESQMSELLDRDSASLLLGEKSGDELLAEVISLDKHDKESHGKKEATISREEAIKEDEPTTSSTEPFPEEQLTTASEEPFPEEEPTTASEEPIAEEMSPLPDEEHFATEESTTSDEELLAEEASIITDEETAPGEEQSIIPDEVIEQEPASGFIPQGYATPTTDETIQPQEPLDEETRFTFEEEYEKPQPNRYRHYWAVASLLLLLPLGGQVAWHLRDSLVAHYAGRQILQGVCSLAGCEVPIRRDTDQIIISNRALTTHPDKEDILTLTLEMVNAAAFQQPFPKLQLSLYNDIGTIIARRTFLPNEYRSKQHQPNQMMPKLKAVHIELELQDPGNEVTGFKFDFL
jgi:predicted Zn finger-like uncharacterized protein